MNRWLILFLAIWSVSVPPSVARADVYGIIVGVNECPQFRLPHGSKPRPLAGAEHDAISVHQMLLTKVAGDASKIVMLKGSEATYENIRVHFRQAAATAKRDDAFVFYFSGHGTQTLDRFPHDETDDELDEALCAYDADETGGQLVLDDELGAWLGDIQALHVTVVLDCCHAGSGVKDDQDDLVPRFLPISRARRTRQPTNEPWRELRSSDKTFGRRLTAFYACKPDQQAYERRFLDIQRRAGQFTYFLIAGLNSGKPDLDNNDEISFQELLLYVNNRLHEEFNEGRAAGDRQEPVLDSSFPHDPIFRYRGTGTGAMSTRAALAP
jgi:uncharacterized caspase-like protein